MSSQAVENRKRKQDEPENESATNPENQTIGGDYNEEDEDEEDIVNVDFDYYNPKEIDFHATKNLLRQLIGPDSKIFDLSALSDIITTSQTFIGSTIKTDGPDSDPLAFLSVLSLKDSSSSKAPVISVSKKSTAAAVSQSKSTGGHVKKALIDYFILKTQDYPKFNRKIRQICSSATDSKVGLILGERLINMPTEVIPPMYKMLSEEMKEASKDSSDKSSDFNFDYIFILSRAFLEQASDLDREERKFSKKSKPTSSSNPEDSTSSLKNKEVFYFHPEDELIHNHALYYHSFKYSTEPQSSDSKRAFSDFGVYPLGHLILLETSKLSEMIEDLEVQIPPF